MFALHVVRGMQPDMFLEGEWDFLVGLLVEAGTEEGGGRAPSWLEAERGGDTARLLATFPSLGANLQLDEGGIWGAFMKTETPEKDLPVQVVIYIYQDTVQWPCSGGEEAQSVPAAISRSSLEAGSS